MAFNTGNPLGSTDPRDLSDNAENFDKASNSSEPTFSDRLGATRKTLSGMESEFNTDQSSRETIFQAFISSSGYEFLGDYAAGIEVTAYNQVIRESGEFWKPAANTTLPYTTTGAGMPESGAFASVGDANLRQEVGGGIRRVSNLTALEGISGRFSGDVAYMVGRTTAGDGGDGEFRWDGSDLSSTLILASVTSTSVDIGTDTITSAGHGLVDGDGVVAQTAVNGLSANTVYWVVNATTDTFQLSETYDGPAFDLIGTTNFTVESLLDPMNGIYVTPASDLTGSSGAWIRQEIHPLKVDWFGADSSGATNSAQALAGLQNYCVRNKDDFHEIHWTAGGTYNIETNRWIGGIRRYRMVLNGAKLINTGSTFDLDFYGFATNRNPNLEQQNFGYETDTIAIGTKTVTLKTTSDISNFFAGCPVLIFGLNTQDGGQPPNAKFFEYNDVDSVDVGAGTITLVRDARYKYRDDWPKVTDAADPTLEHGPVRIMPLRSATNPKLDFCEYAEWSGGVVEGQDVNSPNSYNIGYMTPKLSRFALIKDMTIDASPPSTSDTIVFENVTVNPNSISQDIEGDKLLRVLKFKDMYVPEISEFTGVETLEAENVTFGGGYARPRNKILKNCEFITTELFASTTKLSAFYSTYGSGLKYYENCKFNLKDGEDYGGSFDFDFIYNNLVTEETVISSSGSPTTTQIELDDTNRGISRKYVEDGAPFYVKNSGSFVFGKVTGLKVGSSYTVADKKVYLEVECNGTVAASDVIVFFTGDTVEFKNNKAIRPGTQDTTPLKNFRYSKNDYSSVTHFSTDWYEDTRALIPVYGILTGVKVSVTKPYTGSDTTPNMLLRSDSTGAIAETISLASSSTNEYTLTSSITARMSESLDVYVQGDGGYRTLQNNAASGSPDKTVMPIVSVEVSYIPATWDFYYKG